MVAWKYRTGAPWRDVPERFGKWNSIFKRFTRWAEDGIWEKLLAEVQKQSDSTIARVHQHGATLGRETGGLSNHKNLREEPLDQIRVPRQRPDRLIVDKGWVPIEEEPGFAAARKIAATIPERDEQIGHRQKKPGRPIEFGDEQKESYKGRNVVERCFNKLKQWPGTAMRSDKGGLRLPCRDHPRRHTD